MWAGCVAISSFTLRLMLSANALTWVMDSPSQIIKKSVGLSSISLRSSFTTFFPLISLIASSIVALSASEFVSIFLASEDLVKRLRLFYQLAHDLSKVQALRHTLIGTTYLFFPHLASTNQVAMELVSKTRPRPGTVIYTDFQTQGQGQYGRKWHGSPGHNLYMSCIISPGIPPSQQSVLSTFASLAVRDTISEFIGTNATIKWPNDVYVGNRKVCGLLIQNVMSSTEVHFSVIGVGINVNETEFPADAPNPTSLKLEGVDTTVQEVRKRLVSHLNEWSERAAALPLGMIHRHFQKHMFRLNERSRFILENGDDIAGTIKGIDDSGRLLLQTETGLKAFHQGHLRYTDI